MNQQLFILKKFLNKEVIFNSELDNKTNSNNSKAAAIDTKSTVNDVLVLRNFIFAGVR